MHLQEELKDDYDMFLNQPHYDLTDDGEQSRTNIVISPQFYQSTDTFNEQKREQFQQQQEQQQQEYDDEDGADYSTNNQLQQQLTDIEQISQEIKKKKAYIWAFGKNGDGELGVGSQKDIFMPISAVLKSGQSAKWISSGSHHSAVVTKQGELYVCGSQLHGKLGIPNLNVMSLPRFQVVNQFGGQLKKVKQVACGDYHTLCLLEEGKVYAWGGTLYKKVGENSKQAQNNEPRIVNGLADKTIIQIDCGDFHSIALDTEGHIYTWGGGGAAYNKGQCGHGDNVDIENPQQVQTLANKRTVKVSAGGFHTLALCDDNELYAWGSGTYGECGFGDFQETNKPRLVKMPNEYISNQEYNQIEDEFEIQQQKPQITQISAGGHHSLVLTSRGRVYSFGYGSHGQLGLKSTKNFSVPQLVKDLISKPISLIAAGWNHSLVLSDRGDLFACGYGNHGQLGLNDKESRTQFTHVANLGSKNIYKMFAGGNHSWVVIDDIIPVREHYRPPSPVGHVSRSASPIDLSPKPPQSSSKLPPTTHLSNSTSNIPFVSQINQVLNSQVKNQNRRRFEFGVHVTYSETSMCHRFVTFEVAKNYQEEQKVKEALDEYIRGIYRDEQGALLYHKYQEGQTQQDDPMPNLQQQHPIQNQENMQQDPEKYFTVCLVFDPERSNVLKPFLQKANKQMKFLGQKQVYYEEIEIVQNTFEQKLSGWAIEFNQKIGEKYCIRRPRFSELRPQYLKGL